MADLRLEGLFASLGAAFEAEVERAEDVAATDLAFSLLQDRSLAAVAARAATALLLPGGVRVEVSEAGRDYVASGCPATVVVPIARALLAVEPGVVSRASSPDRTCVELLREWARRKPFVQVSVGEAEVIGVLSAVGRDHLAVQSRGRIVYVSFPEVRYVRRGRGGSRDDS